MNITEIKESLKNNIGKKIKIKVYALRNRIYDYEGTISNVYPNLFTVIINNEEKSFSYADVITGEVKIKF